jgi:hypothetical protein
MKIFDHEKSVVLVAGVENQEFTPTEGTSYYDTLAEDSIDASVISTDNEYQIEYYKSLIEKYNKNTELSRLQKNALKDVNKILSNIDEKVDEIITKTELITTEYYTNKIGNAIEKISSTKIIENINEKVVYALALFLGLILSTLIIIDKEFIKSKNRKVRRKK